MGKRVGLIVNPIAGMGGKVSLKGTDGPDILSRAISLGAVPETEEKAACAMAQLADLAEPPLILTCAGAMGQTVCQRLGLPHELVGEFGAVTTAGHTMIAAKEIQRRGVDLFLFAGGDGTARDICAAVGESLPVLGIPAGVKIQSAVFALSPLHAGQLAAKVLSGAGYQLVSQEVIDLDEEAYRGGTLSSSLYGYLNVPTIRGYIQNMKQSGFSDDGAQLTEIADHMVEHMDPDAVYAVGSGSTAKCVMRRLNLPYELLGVDLIQNRCLIKRDVTEQQLYQAAATQPLHIIVSPIGGQGFLFGRGNLQFSARVLQAVGKTNIQVVATASKLLSIPSRQLRTDCGDHSVNAALSGYYPVCAGYDYQIVMPCNPEYLK